MSLITLRTNQIMESYQDARFALPKKFKYWSITHTHDFYEIFLVVEGTVVHTVNNVRQVLSAGTMVFIRPHDVHSFERNGNDEFSILNVNFRSNTMLHAFDYLGSGFKPERLRETELPPMLHVSTADIEHTLGLYQRTTALLSDSRENHMTPVRAYLMELLLRFFYPRAEIVSSAGPKWLHELLKEMNSKDNLTEGLARMQQLSPVSPEHLCRTVKKYMDKTPTEWINEMRLRVASKLLESSMNDVATISYDAGFNSLSHFYTLFFKQFGMSPNAYRRDRNLR